MVCLLQVLTGTAWSQLPAISFETLTTRDGLPSGTVLCATKDHRGFMWFGTRLCPTRYDGATFRSLLVPETHFVTGLAEDARHQIWASTDRGGVCRINPLNLQMEAIALSDSADSKEAGYFFIDSQQQGWYSDRYGVNRVDLELGKKTHYAFRTTTYVGVKGSFVEDQQHNVWVIGSDNGLFRYDRKADRLVCTLGTDCPDPGRNETFIFGRACVDQAGMLWIGTYNRGMIRYDPRTDQYEEFADVNDVASIEEGFDEAGRRILWIGTQTRLGIFRPEQKRAYFFETLLPDAYVVNDIFRDPDTGIVWVCTTAGILKYHPQSNLIQTVQLPEEMFNQPVSITTVLADRTDPTGNTFWLGLSHTGMLRWNRRTRAFALVPYPPAGSAPETRWMVQRADGTLWIGVNQWQYNGNGLLVYDPVKEQFLETPLSRLANGHYSVPFYMYGFFDAQQRLWIGNSDEGIHVFDARTCREVTPWDSLTQYQLLRNNNLINDLRLGRDGTVWLATYQGVYQADEKGRRFVKVDSLLTPGQLQDPATNTVYEATNGQVWAARWGSVTQADAKGIVRKVLSAGDGMFDRENRGLVQDDWGQLWIGNYEGLHCYDPVTSRLLRFTENDGLLSNNTMGRLYIHQGKELFIGQKNGFNILEIEKMRHPNAPPPVAVSTFKVHEKERNLDLNQPIRLERSENAFSVDFIALNYSKLQNNRYAYFMEGFDTEWNYIGSQHLAYYTNLDPGTYTLHLKAGDALGNWNQRAIRLQIEILPAYYETAWFRLLMALLLIGVLYAAYQYRIRQLLRLQKVRNHISADLHDEIGASLSGISIMGSIARNGLPAQHPAATFLDRIVEETQQMSSSLDDIVWSINPNNDELSQLIARMNRHASELLEARGIEYKIELPQEVGELKLPMEHRRDFYLIFKEALNNLLKYSGCTQAAIEIRLHGHHLQLVIWDNGTGFDPDAHSERNGIRNLRKRSQNLRGQLRIQSAPGCGTTIQLEFPLSA